MKLFELMPNFKWVILFVATIHLYVIYKIITKKEFESTTPFAIRILFAIVFPISLYQNYRLAFHYRVIAISLVVFYLGMLDAVGFSFMYSIKNLAEQNEIRIAFIFLSYLIPIFDLSIHTLNKYFGKSSHQ
jgi:CDP-diglyceride synthetase